MHKTLTRPAPPAMLISPEEQIANVQSVLLHFVLKLGGHGKTMKDAERLVARPGLFARTSKGRARRDAIAWLGDALAALNARDHWRQLKVSHADGELRPI